MRRSLTARLLLSGALALSAPVASAQHGSSGLNLFWDDCHAGGGTTSMSFACDANTPAASMFVSVYPEASMAQFAAASVKLHFRFAGGGIPPWWQTAAGQCRQDAIQASFHPDDLLDAQACASIWQGHAPLSVYGVYPNRNGPGTMALEAVAAVPSGSELNFVADGREYVVARVTVLSSRTVGEDACAGCLAGACVWLGEIRLLSPTEPTQTILRLADNIVVVHNAYLGLVYPDFVECFSTPTANRTWGAIKTLYR